MAAKRVVLVTGAGSGIGAACVRRLAAPGTAVLLHTRRNAEGLERVAEAARAAGAEAATMLGDIGDAAVPAGLVARAVEEFGGLDVVVTAAGFADKTPFAQADDAIFQKSIDGVLWGFLRTARAALPHLAGRPAPRIIAISSFVAHVFRTDVSTFPASAAAKGAVEALVRALAVEAAKGGITVNAVAPGYTRKDPGAHAALSQAQWDAVTAKIPMGRLGTPDDVAEAVAYFASPAAGYVTGQVLHVNGGLI
ncbi:SDR family oxidoreductase [Roseomonas stagni]|uniref:SDR family oxidoreductase n=1 Tax=Falsiroseomonas algicola TaxID=2716930 RepID=A0A6M1LRL1_9PROT|nr:SDR family oxidoreductase [Falsiroseomonas algicola]NGM23065.1 SDR family oxidoreductase [Falsiroseomonas algicola]